MFQSIKKLIFKKGQKFKKVKEDEDYWYEEEWEEVKDVVYNKSSKILIVTKTTFMIDKDNMTWYRGTIQLEKAKEYLQDDTLDKGDLVEVTYEESIIDGEVVDRKIEGMKKLEGFSYNVKRQKSKVKEVHNVDFTTRGIEFENGHTYLEGKALSIDFDFKDEDTDELYKEKFMNEDNLWTEVYLEILKDGVDTGKAIVIVAYKEVEGNLFSVKKASSIKTLEDVMNLLDEQQPSLSLK